MLTIYSELDVVKKNADIFFQIFLQIVYLCNLHIVFV